MTEQSEFDLSRSNEFIRDCALKKRPIFDSYKKLCEIRKNPKIDYVDFEWTYYQYYHENQDLTIQRSPENSSTVTFSDLPMDVLESVVQKSALGDCLVLRKVSHDLRNLVDSTEVYCEKIEFIFGSRCSNIKLDNTEIVYQENRDGFCRITSRRNAAHHEENRDFEKAMLADASTFLKNPKLKIGELCFVEASNKTHTELGEFLQSLNFLLDTRSVNIYSYEDRIPSVLQFLKPGTLEKIEIDAQYGIDGVDEIVETEQWKMAKRLKWRRLSNEFGMEKMLHFKEIDFYPFRTSAKNLVMIRDILLKSAHFESCHLGIEHVDVDEDSLIDEYKNEVYIVRIMSQDPAFDVRTRRFSIPNSRDYFQLWFEREEYGYVIGLSIDRYSEN